MTVVIALLGLIFLIVIHEMGHMLTAKALGVRVPEFAVGFGPALFKKKFGETVYSLRIILLGGFAKMAGMEGAAGVELEKDEMGPDTYPSKPPWRRALIIFAGPFANILAAIAILAVALMISGVVTGVKPVVDRIEPGSMAQQVGLQAGDRLVAVDGEEIGKWQGFTDAVAKKSPGDEISLTVMRNGLEQQFSGKLGADSKNPERALVGVGPVVERTTYGPLESVSMASQQLWQLTLALGGFVGELVTGQQSFYDNVTGPVGIATVGSESVSQGIFLQLLAFISLNLALFNLLPILPLDGGHLLFIALEKVMGRRISPEVIGRVAVIGFALMLTLFLFATYADISKLFSGQPFIPE